MELNLEDYQEHNAIIRRKAEFFLEKSQPVHITYKKIFWRNGFIKEVGADFIILNDFKEGEIVVFFLEIADMEMFTPPKKEEGHGSS